MHLLDFLIPVVLSFVTWICEVLATLLDVETVSWLVMTSEEGAVSNGVFVCITIGWHDACSNLTST